MPKPPLVPEEAVLENQMIETLRAGLHNWRPDLNYPESYSDMQACVRGLMSMFEVKRRPLAVLLKSPCPDCDGSGDSVRLPGERHTCPNCHGRKYVEIRP